MPLIKYLSVVHTVEGNFDRSLLFLQAPVASILRSIGVRFSSNTILLDAPAVARSAHWTRLVRINNYGGAQKYLPIGDGVSCAPAAKVYSHMQTPATNYIPLNL